jgi:antitoxin PrlF
MRTRATVTSKGRVTIPLEVRRRLGIKQGDRIEFVVKDGLTVVRPVREEGNPFEAYVGVLEAFDGVDEVIEWQRSLRDES